LALHPRGTRGGNLRRAARLLGVSAARRVIRPVTGAREALRTVSDDIMTAARHLHPPLAAVRQKPPMVEMRDQTAAPVPLAAVGPVANLKAAVRGQQFARCHGGRMRPIIARCGDDGGGNQPEERGCRDRIRIGIGTRRGYRCGCERERPGQCGRESLLGERACQGPGHGFALSSGAARRVWDGYRLAGSGTDRQ